MTVKPSSGDLPCLVDTHCHLDFHAFDEDRDEVVLRARQVGMVRILNPGIDLSSSWAAVRLASTYPEVYAAIGVHPNDSLTWNEVTLPALIEMASIKKAESHSKVVAIGEIGLDYYRDRVPHDMQRLIFQNQLELAAKLELPVVIHNRQASEDLLSILSDWQAGLSSSGSPLAERPGVLHSFSETEEFAQQAIRLNFCIGITGSVTFRNASTIQRVVAEIPLDHLLVETDSPFLSPHPHRGQRNAPDRVRLVVNKIAELHHVPVSVVADTTSMNAQKLFRW